MSLQSIRWCRGVSLQLIRLVNANDLIDCGGDPWGPMEVCGGVCIIVCPWLPLVFAPSNHQFSG